jgi:uncharacterized protein (TIGR02391 family)
MPAYPSLDDNTLGAICDILADTSTGLTGSELTTLLARKGIEDPEPTLTKRKRLFLALHRKQASDRCANNVLAFVQEAMAPVRYVQNRPLFEDRRKALNVALALAGYHLGEDGQLRPADKARTLSDAEARANMLSKHLVDRRVHPVVLQFCKGELLEDNYFHAVLEAAKSVSQRIRELTGLNVDGSELVDQAFGSNSPKLAINRLDTEAAKMAQRGFANLLRGVVGMFRNPTAHAPKIYWPIDEEEALDILTIISLVHKKLDKAARTGH